MASSQLDQFKLLGGHLVELVNLLLHEVTHQLLLVHFCFFSVHLFLDSVDVGVIVLAKVLRLFVVFFFFFLKSKDICSID